MITVLHRGGYAQMITILHREGGSLGTPKSDYVICARSLNRVGPAGLTNLYICIGNQMAASTGSSSTVGCFPSLPYSYTGINFYHKDSDVGNDD